MGSVIHGNVPSGEQQDVGAGDAGRDRSRPAESPAISAPVVQRQGRPPTQAGDGGSTPTLALQSLRVQPVAFTIIKQLIERHHYLHSMPGGTMLSFGVFHRGRLYGGLTLGAGPAQAFRLVRDAAASDCLALTRLWLSDALPMNSESRIIAAVIRALRRYTRVRFLVCYADPAVGHVGVIYQATGWLYTGLSDASPLYDIGDGRLRHSRSFSHGFGTHSTRHFQRQGVDLHAVPQQAKHRYLYPLDPAVRDRILVPILPYPRKEQRNADR